MNPCEPDKHRWEYGYVHHGEQWKVCMNCGEQELDFFHDVGSGG